MNNDNAPVVIMAGGTGGHIFPALAVAHELMQQAVPVVWLGTAEGMEAKLVAEQGIPMAPIRARALRGKGWLARIRALIGGFSAMIQALVVLQRRRPRCVLGFGGYVAAPGGIAARILGIPLIIHEQNAIAGMTNRILAMIATRVLHAFPGAFAANDKMLCVGNPVRDEIVAVPTVEQRFDGREGPLRVLVLGGSRGAQALNEAVPRAIALLPSEMRPSVRHQTGERGWESTAQLYAELGLAADIQAFIRDISKAYAWADVVLCRAGALTIAELAAAGVGSILVPYPHAVDDHQTANARFLVEAGAAQLLPQVELTPQVLSNMMRGLTRPELLARASRARALRKLDVAKHVAAICLDKSKYITNVVMA